MPAKYVRPYSKGQKNDFRDAEAIAEAVQRPTIAQRRTREPLDRLLGGPTCGKNSFSHLALACVSLPDALSTTLPSSWL